MLAGCTPPASVAGDDEAGTVTSPAGRSVAVGVAREYDRTAVPSPTATPRIEDGMVILPCGDPLVPIDKGHRLEGACVPADLVALPGSYSSGGTQLLTAEAAAALRDLIDDARTAGLELWAASSYRSFQEQETLFAYWVNQLGLAEALRVSARPGHSEHQLGTTTDVIQDPNDGLDGFRGTPEAAWVAENAWRFGFVVSYPADKEHITGYVHEPWHIRYVGIDVARAVRDSGLTPVEYLRTIR